MIISQGGAPDVDASVEVIPEGFSPLDCRQSLCNLWRIRLVATFLVFQNLPLFREILHYWSPLKISNSGIPANSVIIVANKLRAIDLAPRTKLGVETVAHAAPTGLGSGTLPAGLRKG